MQQLAAIGHVVYAYLGVTTESLTPTLARHLGFETQRGAIVSSVRSGSPSARAGLRGGSGDETFNGQEVTLGGDLIVAMDGQAVRSADDVVRQVAAKLPGQIASLTIIRKGKRQVVSVRLGSRPSAPEASR
jgi:S1-C subfamily serine protease